LQQLTLASQRLAAGDLGAQLPDSNRNDEVGSVVKAYTSMVISLRNISAAAQKVAQGDLRVEVQPRSDEDSLGKAFASMVENMSSATSQIKSAVEVLSSAVSNIMASVSDSASGATETATAVTETTTTVEEVRQTSHIANQKAKNVAESAQKSAQISTMGRKSTEETIQGMKRIREQMDLIADSMVRLSEKSQSIVEIIATVDDLAQQSNLLAVNASIEAAKAGELGRGFAVVAQEVKSMSDQSKHATAQVRKILGEIQQATSSAAMATELGSRAVDAAVTQSNQAGEAISTLASSVAESANAAAQIAVSSQQQLAGVDQVATAMLGIKDATAQNLIAIRRVEEATLTLQELGGTLKVLTKRYQL
jgi:methyl-accepting chemotaxis protein